MKIKNYVVTDKYGNRIELNFADWKAQSDAGESYPFQVIRDSDTVAVYRQIDELDVHDAYTATWWRVDIVQGKITSGADCALSGGSVDYKEKTINCTKVQNIYEIAYYA